MDVDTLSHSNSTRNLQMIVFSIAQSALVDTVLLAQKSLLSVLFMISKPGDISVVSDLTMTDNRFPLAELNKMGKPAAENKDAGETEEEDGEDDDCDNDQGDDDSSGEEGSDDDDDSDGEVNGDREIDDDDDDEDEDEDDDGDDDDNDEDDEEEDEEEEAQPPSKKKK